MDKDIGKGWRLKEINIPPFAPAGKSFEAVTEAAISASRPALPSAATGTPSGCSSRQEAQGQQMPANTRQIVWPPAMTRTGPAFRRIATNVTLTGYVYDPGQNVVSEILIAYP